MRPVNYRLPESTHLGRAVLQVSSLDRSLAYYCDLLGFDVVRSGDRAAILKPQDGENGFVELREKPGVRAVPRGGAIGLYHVAVLLPDRAALGRFVHRLLELDVRFGSANHLVSESIYLWDPDNLGLEVYADRPRDTWRVHGEELVMATEPLDFRAVLGSSNGEKWVGMPRGTTLGHMHLSVGDLDAARRFYHRSLGLDLTVWSYPGALFYSAGGYHHHLGTNTWAAQATPATDDEARLLEWELILPSMIDVQDAAASVRAAGYSVSTDNVATDPWGTRLRLRT